MLSHATAVRFPVPVTMITSACPLSQPCRLTISRTTLLMSEVCWPGPARPTVDQGGGRQVTTALVRGRDDTFNAALVNVRASSAASPAMFNVGVPPSVSSTVNWIHAAVMVAPKGIVTPAKRIPTT
jgi:hypothetical protein